MPLRSVSYSSISCAGWYPDLQSDAPHSIVHAAGIDLCQSLTFRFTMTNDSGTHSRTHIEYGVYPFLRLDQSTLQMS